VRRVEQAFEASEVVARIHLRCGHMAKVGEALWWQWENDHATGVYWRRRQRRAKLREERIFALRYDYLADSVRCQESLELIAVARDVGFVRDAVTIGQAWYSYGITLR